MGDTKGGAFDIDGKLARAWLVEPVNANGRPNSDVLRPWINGLDLTRRKRDIWIIDFGSTLGEREVALYASPFAHVLESVKPDRSKNRRDAYRVNWWHHVEPRPAMRAALNALELSARDAANSTQTIARYLITPRVAKHRLFAWASQSILPDSRLYAFARSDDCFFGILQSMQHTAWTLATCSWHGVGNDPTYNAESVFLTFPFPAGLTPNISAAAYAADPRAQRIAAAAKALDELRRAWLNPPDLVDVVPEVTPTAAPGEAPRRYPDRILPKTVEAAVKLKERTLTNLYNQRPRWLADAHEALDRAVASAYGWPEDIAIDDALQRLLAPTSNAAPSPLPAPSRFTQVSAGARGHVDSPLSTGFAGPARRSSRSAVTPSHRCGDGSPRSSTDKSGPIGSGLSVEDLDCERPESRAGVSGGRRPPAQPARSAIDAEHGSGIRAPRAEMCEYGGSPRARRGDRLGGYGHPNLSEIQDVCYCCFSVNPKPVRTRAAMNDPFPPPPKPALTTRKVLLLRTNSRRRQAPGLTPLDRT